MPTNHSYRCAHPNYRDGYPADTGVDWCEGAGPAHRHGIHVVSAASIAAACTVALVVSLIVSIVIGGAASLMSDAPGHEHPITTLGHRAIGWASAVGLITVATVIALEHLP